MKDTRELRSMVETAVRMLNRRHKVTERLGDVQAVIYAGDVRYMCSDVSREYDHILRNVYLLFSFSLREGKDGMFVNISMARTLYTAPEWEKKWMHGHVHYGTLTSFQSVCTGSNGEIAKIVKAAQDMPPTVDYIYYIMLYTLEGFVGWENIGGTYCSYLKVQEDYNKSSDSRGSKGLNYHLNTAPGSTDGYGFFSIRNKFLGIFRFKKEHFSLTIEPERFTVLLTPDFERDFVTTVITACQYALATGNEEELNSILIDANKVLVARVKHGSNSYSIRFSTYFQYVFAGRTTRGNVTTVEERIVDSGLSLNILGTLVPIKVLYERGHIVENAPKEDLDPDEINSLKAAKIRINATNIELSDFITHILRKNVYDSIRQRAKQNAERYFRHIGEDEAGGESEAHAELQEQDQFAD